QPTADGRQHAALTPPTRFAEVRFSTYRPQNDMQTEALREAERLAGQIRERYTAPWWKRVFGNGDNGLRGGLYLVGPVGTGKTHLLASIYHALQPDVPCAFTHSSDLFRARQRPEDYARSLAEQARVLLIDEVELDDPAAEVRLIHVLKTLRDLGVTVAATSNAEPEKFVSAQFGRDRLERFISEEFRNTYHVVFVGGEDFRQRLAKPGKAWVGPREATQAAMRLTFDADARPKRWVDFEDLLHLATTTERSKLLADLLESEALYFADIDVDNTDDALRLLRVVDDLYTADPPPILHFTSVTMPERWFNAEDVHVGLEASIAEKFLRTTSRLHAMCHVERVGAQR
ncbi:MAG: AFG1/ZapE family ATPase, partial [Bacteroidota bacterium]